MNSSQCLAAISDLLHGEYRSQKTKTKPGQVQSAVLIALGVVMLMQPFALALFTWSFPVTLTGTVLFIITSHFRE